MRATVATAAAGLRRYPSLWISSKNARGSAQLGFRPGSTTGAVCETTTLQGRTGLSRVNP